MRSRGTEIRTWTPKAQAATVIVAASDSLHPERADYVCPGAADDVTLQAALDELAAAGGGKLLQLPGTYTWTSAVTYSESNLEWGGVGEVVNDCSAIAGNGGALRIEGAITGTNSALTGDAAKGQKDVTVADASSFAAGDWIRIRSEALFNSGTQHLGEIQKIASIAGNVITCEDVLAFDCDVADTGTVDLLTVYENIQLKNMYFIGNYGVSQWKGFLFRELHNVLLEDIHWTDGKCYPILTYDIVGFEVRGCSVKDSDQSGLGYGVCIENASRDILIHGNKFYNCRHGIACAGDSTYGVQTNQVYDSNTFRYSTQHMAALGPHNTYDGLVISNNTVMNDGLTYIAGINTTVTGNCIYNDSCANGAILLSPYAKDVVIQGNIILASNQYGIALGIGSTGTYENVIISNNIIKVLAGSYSAIYGRYGYCTNLQIDGNYIYSLGYTSIYLRDQKDGSRISILNNTISSDAAGGIKIGTAASYAIEKLMIENNSIETIATQNGISPHGVGAGDIKYTQIRGNTLINSNIGMHILHNEYFNIHDNTFVDVITGIRIQSSGNHYSIRDNRFINCTTPIDDQVEGTRSVYEQRIDLLMDVLAVSATHVRSNEDLSEAIPNTFTITAQPDIPRTLSGHFDTHANITAYTIDIVGVDAKGNTVTETKTEADGWDWETSNAFATITSIIMSARTGTGATDTMDIGITDVLGLSNVIYATGDVFKIKKNTANATVAGAQVNATYGTYDMSVITLGVGDDFTIWYKSNLNIIS